MLVSFPLGGWISDRLTLSFGNQIGRRWVPLGGTALAIGFLYLGTITLGTVATTVTMSLAIGFAAFCEGPFWATVTELGGDHVAAAGAILNTGSNVGGLFAPIVAPLIAARFGWSWGLYSACFVALLGMIACYLEQLPSGPRG